MGPSHTAVAVTMQGPPSSFIGSRARRMFPSLPSPIGRRDHAANQVNSHWN